MPPKKRTKSKETFETALERLESIVTALEAGDVPLEESLKQFEEGMTLARFCGAKLDEVEKKVSLLVSDPKGTVQETPFDPSDA